MRPGGLPRAEPPRRPMPARRGCVAVPGSREGRGRGLAPWLGAPGLGGREGAGLRLGAICLPWRAEAVNTGPRPALHPPLPEPSQPVPGGGVEGRAAGPGNLESQVPREAVCGPPWQTARSSHARPSVDLPPGRSSGEWELRMPPTQQSGLSVPGGAPPTSNPLRPDQSPSPPTHNSCPSRKRDPSWSPGPTSLASCSWPVASRHVSGGLCPSYTGTPETGLDGTLSSFSAPLRPREGGAKMRRRIPDHCCLGNHQFSLVSHPCPPKFQAPSFSSLRSRSPRL